MTEKKGYEYIEDRDVLGQPKTNAHDSVRNNRWPIILIILSGLLFITVMIYNIFFKDHRQATYYPDGTIESRGDYNSSGQGSGLHTDYWEDGSIHRETNFNDKGKLHGTSKLWNRNGILISESNYENGMRHGHYKRRDENGILTIHELYNSDSLTKKIK